MKVKFFLDVYPGMDIKWLTATTTPGEKSTSLMRVGFVVEIPDTLVYQEDMALPATVAMEEK